jgi:hypothetical protein
VSASPIRITRFDPQTGEMLVDPKTKAILEEVIPARDFRPQPPKFPTAPDESKITLVKRGRVSGPTGRSVVAMTSYRWAIVEFWGFHAHILARHERATLLRSGGSSVLRPIAPEWKIGDRMYLASDIEAEVVEMTESERGFGTVFRIHDYRMMYLRRGVIGTDTPKTDKQGFAAPLDPGREKQAAIDSAYTRVASQAVHDSGAVMDPHAYEQIHADRSSHRALTQSKRRRKLSVGQLEARLREAEDKNQQATVKVLKRKLKVARASEKVAA